MQASDVGTFTSGVYITIDEPMRAAARAIARKYDELTHDSGFETVASVRLMATMEYADFIAAATRANKNLDPLAMVVWTQKLDKVASSGIALNALIAEEARKAGFTQAPKIFKQFPEMH